MNKDTCRYLQASGPWEEPMFHISKVYNNIVSKAQCAYANQKKLYCLKMQTQRHEVSMYSWKNGVDKVPRHRIATNLQCGKTTVKWSVVRQGMPGYIQYLGSCWGISASNVFHSQVWPVKSYTQESSCSLSFLGLMKVTLEGKNPAYGRPIRWKKPRSCVSFGPLGSICQEGIRSSGDLWGKCLWRI